MTIELLENKTISYKSKTRYVFPTQARSMLKEYKQCVLGFSMQNSKFENPKMESMIEWINKRFEKCNVFVGDSIHRITVQIDQGISETLALEEASRIVDEAIERTQGLFENEANSCKYEFVRCSEIQKTPEYSTYYTQICDLFKNDEKFKKSVLGFADTFLNRGERGMVDTTDINIKPSCNYLLEEMAVLECFVRRGYPVFVYPGSMATLIETSNGEHPGVPEGLKNMVCVTLDIKRR